MSGTPDIRELVGLQFSVTHHAGNMRMFHFGKVTREGPRRARGECALHVQCPWRIESGNEMVTGFHDWWHFVGGAQPVDWEPGTGGSLQELRLRELFACPLDEDRLIINKTASLVVTDVGTDAHGGCRIALDNHLFIVVLPCTAAGEYWRLFQPGGESPHLISEAIAS